LTNRLAPSEGGLLPALLSLFLWGGKVCSVKHPRHYRCGCLVNMKKVFGMQQFVLESSMHGKYHTQIKLAVWQAQEVDKNDARDKMFAKTPNLDCQLQSV
jgi:hypothetical protein